MSTMTAKAVGWTETGLVPDSVIRAGIRRLLENKLREIQAGDVEHAADTLNAFVGMMDASPIALVPEVANEQHYEVPAEFFGEVMGDYRKYSCCFWPEGINDLTSAEAAALAKTVERADIKDGMQILDMGCGWGSLSLYIARNFPGCKVLAVSNSTSQQAYIQSQAKAFELDNLEVQVCDMNDFDTDRTFDRIVSVEMFEHMRNYRQLFRSIKRWSNPGAKFFMHIFCHRTTPYEFIDKGPGDWMSRYFFTGGIMPSADLPLRFTDTLNIEKRWHWSGLHYERTCNAWLEQMDGNKDRIMPILEDCYSDDAAIWWQRWRMFFMACAELFAYRDGREWYVGHYLFSCGE